MRRWELMVWAAVLIVLVILNSRSAPRAPTPAGDAVRRTADRSDEALESPAAGGPTQKPLAKSKRVWRPDEDAPPPPELPPRQRVTLPVDALRAGEGVRTKRPVAIDHEETEPPALLEQSGVSWRTEPLSPCEWMNDLYEAVLDHGSDTRSRLVGALVATFAANASGAVADVASKSLHATVGLLRSAPAKLTSVSFERAMFETARHLLSEHDRQCGVAISTATHDTSVLHEEGGLDILVIGSVRHAESIMDRIIGGEILVNQYVLVAQSRNVAGEGTPSLQAVVDRFTNGKWVPDMMVQDLGFVALRQPRFMSLSAKAVEEQQERQRRLRSRDAPSASSRPNVLEALPAQVEHIDDADLGPIPARITTPEDRDTYRSLQRRFAIATKRGDADRASKWMRQLDDLLAKYTPRSKRPIGDEEDDAIRNARGIPERHQLARGDNGGAEEVHVGGRELQQLRDDGRIVSRRRPKLQCHDALRECDQGCQPSLLCGGSDDIALSIQEQEELDKMVPARAASLLFHMITNVDLPIAPYASFIAASALSRNLDANIVILGCYPSLAAAACAGARGEYSRITVVTSGSGCNVLRQKVRGGLRNLIPDANLQLVDVKSRTNAAPGSLFITTTRFVNRFPNTIASIPHRSMLVVLGTSTGEPLRQMPVLTAVTRLHGGIGMTAFLRPVRSDHDE